MMQIEIISSEQKTARTYRHIDPPTTMSIYYDISYIASGVTHTLYGILPRNSKMPTVTLNPEFAWYHAAVMDNIVDFSREKLYWEQFSLYLMIFISNY